MSKSRSKQNARRARPRRSRRNAATWLGERIGLILLSLNFFLLMAVYYVLKTVRESLILTQGGAEVKSYSAIAQTVALLIIMPAYSTLASRVNRVRLIDRIIGVCTASLLGFAALDCLQVRIGVIFFVWVGIFSVMVVAQMWAFANDAYSEGQGKRILPTLGMAAALGAVAGSQFAVRICTRLATVQIMILAAILLILCAGITRAADWRERIHSAAQAAIATQPIGGADGFRIIRKSRYLLLIAVLIVLVNVANSTGEFMLSKLAVQHADRMIAEHVAPVAAKRALIESFYGSYFAWGSFAGLILQGLLVPRVLRGLGASRSLLVGPGMSALGYSLVAIAPGLGVTEAAKIAENSLDYTLGRTALNALFLNSSRAAKYKAKTIIDTVFYRGGDLLQGLLVLGGTNLAFSVRQYALLNVTLALISAGVVFAIDREQRMSQTFLASFPSISRNHD